MKEINNWSDEKVKSNVLKIANSRGKKPVMRDLKKAREIIYSIINELNPCDAKNTLKEIDFSLWKILCEEANN